MAANTFDSLVGQIQPYCIGAPYPLIISAIADSARTLCKRSKCWSELQTITLSSGESQYSVSPQDGYSSSRTIRWVLIGGNKLQPATNDSIATGLASLLTTSGTPTHYLLNQDMDILLLPIPSESQNGVVATVSVSFVPTYDATSIPSPLVERFAEALILGAKSYLLAIPAMPWSDQQAAIVYKTMFNEEVTKAEVEVMTDYGASDITIKPRRFGA